MRCHRAPADAHRRRPASSKSSESSALWLRALTAALLGALALAPLPVGAASAEAAGRCGPRPAERSVATFVLLIGHPAPPAGSGLAELSAVDDDVMHMAAFFAPWAPRRTIMLLDPPLALRAALAGRDVRPPTWSALTAAVEDLATDLRAIPGEKRVYVYYAGHGERYRAGPYARTRLFLARDPEGRGPGHDGILDPTLLAERVLDPLARHATVHFIADACQSWFVLEGRAVSRRTRVFKLHPGADPGMTRSFAARHPRVGAMLATNGSQSTYEDPTLGGLFSHALRSAAIGLADLDGDGVLTYREMELALGWILAGRSGVAAPGVMGPSDRADAPFIDLASAVDGARICLDPATAGRRELLTANRLPFATIAHGAIPTPIVLERGRRWHTRDAGPDWWTFVAADGALGALRRRPETVLAARGHDFGALFAAPLPEDLAGTAAPSAAAPWSPRSYVALGASLRGLLYPGDGPSTATGGFGGDLTLRVGTGRHHFGAELGVRAFDGTYNFGSIGLETQVYGLRAVYGFYVFEGRLELALGADAGVGLSRSTETGHGQWYLGTVPEAAARVTLALPLPEGQRSAARLVLRGGAMGFQLEDRFGVHPLVELGLGFDWELGVE